MDKRGAAILGGMLVLMGVALGAGSRSGPAAQKDFAPATVDPPSLPPLPADRSDEASLSLGKTEVIKQLEESFRDLYLTLISIIQGVTVAFLAEHLFAAPHPTTSQWLAYVVCFLVMVVVWMEYMVGSCAFTWIPTLLDSVIPFSLGMAQFPLIIAARESAGAFLTRLAIFLAVGVVAYGNWLYHARHGGSLNQHSRPILCRYVIFGSTACLATLAVVVVLVVLHNAGVGISDTALLATALVVVQPLFLHSLRDWSWALSRIRDHAPESRT